MNEKIRYSLAIAGSTEHTVLCAEQLLQDGSFEISWILTPSPRKIGRKQELVKNPLHLFAEKHSIPPIFVEKRIDKSVQEEVIKQKSIDFLLVVDFGYLIPPWLLELPTIAPINVHPSDLPKYRGSSPGQFLLLYGEKKTAISVIIMNDSLDEGDIIYQDDFDILSTYFTQSFYTSAFTQISKKLPQILVDFAIGKIQAHPQPNPTTDGSSTPIARRLTREDGFIPWAMLSEIMNGSLPKSTESYPDLSPLLKEVHETVHDWPQVIANAVRALTPWPGVWTIVSTHKGDKRMKVLEVEKKNDKIDLITVQIEGLEKTPYQQIKNQITHSP